MKPDRLESRIARAHRLRNGGCTLEMNELACDVLALAEAVKTAQRLLDAHRREFLIDCCNCMTKREAEQCLDDFETEAFA